MTREEALQFLKEKIKNKNLVKHCLAVEAVMRELAKYFQEDVERWGLAGLLHDIDYEETKNYPEKHSLVGAKILKSKGLDKDIVEAVKTHNEIHKIEPKTKMAKALFCVDPLTGLIVAATLVLPSKKIADLSVKSILKRFKEPRFAAGAKREIIAQSKKLLNLDLENLVEISLKAMQKISNELEL